METCTADTSAFKHASWLGQAQQQGSLDGWMPLHLLATIHSVCYSESSISSPWTPVQQSLHAFAHYEEKEDQSVRAQVTCTVFLGAYGNGEDLIAAGHDPRCNATPGEMDLQS